MYDKNQTTGIFTAAQSGLQSTLQYLFQNNKEGITRTSLNNAMYGTTTANPGVTSNIATNSPFFQMISGQFATLDKNNDGTLSPDEANTMVNNLSSGLTRDQVLLLKSQGTIDNELANKIITNFAKIDTNGDGKVSESEINAYCMDKDIEAKRDEQKELLLKNMSLYYDTDVESTSDKES